MPNDKELISVDEQKVREIVLAAMAGLEMRIVRHIDSRILELEAEFALVHDRLDEMVVDIKDGQKHWTKVSRQQMVDRVKVERLEKRVALIEQLKKG